MKRSESRPLAVGAVFLITLAIIGVSVFFVGEEHRVWQGRELYRIEFSHTNGLQESAPVALNGVTVGSVSRMRFPPDPRAQFVSVTLSISSSVAPRIRRDTVGRIQTLGMLGDKYIELTSGSLDSEVLPPGGLIRSIDPVDYEALLGQSGDVVSNAIEVTALLRQVLNDILTGEGIIGRLINDKEFGGEFVAGLNRTAASLDLAAARIERMTARMEAGEGALGALVAEDGSGERILENLEEASVDAAEFAHKLNHGSGTISRLVEDEELATATLARLSDATTSIANVTGKINRGEGTLGKLVNDPSLYDNANAWVGAGTRGGFWRLLGGGLSFFLPAPDDPGESDVDPLD
ncbi:MAG: MlaD family protein [Candidatus Binatia bacterium]